MRRSRARSSPPMRSFRPRRRRSTRTRSRRGFTASGRAMPRPPTSSSTRKPTKKPPPAKHEGIAMPDTPAADRQTLFDLEDHAAFARRHIGPTQADQAQMLAVLGYASRAALIDAVVPPAIRSRDEMGLGPARGEEEALGRLRAIAARNRVFRSHIGQGYYGTFVPTVVRRNVLENPAWYTAYTPYQAEISQGRLEALLNFQTMVADLTCMDIANASMLDEATAAAEAMTLARRSVKSKSNVFLVSGDCHPQTIEVL